MHNHVQIFIFVKCQYQYKSIGPQEAMTYEYPDLFSKTNLKLTMIDLVGPDSQEQKP